VLTARTSRAMWGERTGVNNARKPRRALIVPAILALAALSRCPCAFALDPSLDVGQYAHASWNVRDGFAKGRFTSIAQTSDGYLWLGTEFGLLRFDGVRAIPWDPPSGERFPDPYIRALLGARDGSLWIGTLQGLARWKDGKLTQYSELAGHYVDALLEDREGTIWAAAGGFDPYQGGRLCAIRGSGVECHGQDGSLGRYVGSLLEDSGGNVWAAGITGITRWKPGPPKVYSDSSSSSPESLVETPDHALLVVGHDKIENLNKLLRIIGGQSHAFSAPGENDARALRPIRIFRDRDGGLWIGTAGQGLFHIHQGRTDVFSKSDGLSSDSIEWIFEDREGNVWVATNSGLDRFREFAITTLETKQGLSNFTVGSVLADRDGSVRIATTGGLNRWKDGHLTIEGTTDRNSSGKSSPDYPAALFQDSRGRLWITTNIGLGYLSGGQFVALKSSFPGGAVHSVVEDTAGSLWIAQEPAGLFRVSPDGNEVQQIAWSKLGHNEVAASLLADSRQGGLWLGFGLGGIVYYKDGQVQRSYAAGDGLGQGRVNHLRQDPDGTIWASTQGGLSRLKGGRIATLSSKNGLPCDDVHWSMEDDTHSVWLYMACGLVQVARPGLDVWSAEVDESKGSNSLVQTQVFDNSDGVSLIAYSVGYSPKVTKSSDGKLWFLSTEGINILDPRHLPFNQLRPPVHIEQITADRKTYDASSGKSGAATGDMRLPPLVRDLEIDYTALSFVAPEKNRFRVKLEGWDGDWQDVGNRRQAFYSNLSPGNYRFRVIASNNSGVWNEAGTFLDFSIAPAYYQTNWFRALCVAGFLALLWGLYQLRLQQLAREFNAGLEARVNERTRIARELHDTLLQSFHGSLLRFQTVSNLLPPGGAKRELDSAVEQAAQAITEGRDAVQELRRSTAVPHDLALSINVLGRDLATAESREDSVVFRVTVEGTPRTLHPILRDELYRIAGEALRNAFRHAEARRIEVEIRYTDRQLRLRIRDDGKGIDAEILSGDGRPGHFGLHGMRERAKIVGGKLDVWSERDSGTEVELSVPASCAYVKSPGRHQSGLVEKLKQKLSRKEATAKS
jgi:signal transduction histidine kinase/ligand-binding sensor domain-containing protein